MRKCILSPAFFLFVTAAFSNSVTAWESEPKTAGEMQVVCDEKYDACFDEARKNVENCGTLPDCSKRYVTQKQKCLEAQQACEKKAAELPKKS